MLRDQKIPIALHHVHFFGQQNEEMAAWYAKVFGAEPGVSPAGFPTANLPGVALNFTKATDATVGTRGRVLDHVGFEVKDLEAFCKKLEGMGITLNMPYRKVPALGIHNVHNALASAAYIRAHRGIGQDFVSHHDFPTMERHRQIRT